MTQKIKVGDRVRGWGNGEHLNKRQLPMYVGEVVKIEPHSDLMVLDRMGRKVYVWLSTAELVSTALPLPKPIDWSKPVRTRGGVAIRVVDRKAKSIGGFNIVGLMEVNDLGHEEAYRWDEHGHCVIRSDHLIAENVPPEPKRRKAVVVMDKHGHCAVYHVSSASTLRDQGYKFIAAREIELVEGEGVPYV